MCASSRVSATKRLARSATEIWFALSLAVDELDEGKLLETLRQADAATAEPFARWKGALDERLAARFGCAVAELRPWHYADPFFQELPPDGAVDLDALFARTATSSSSRAGRSTVSSSTWPRSSAAATCIRAAGSASTPSASTSTATATSGCSRTSSRTRSPRTPCCTSSGHGVYDLGLSQELPWLLRSAHVVATEASAIFFGSLARKREWLQVVLGLGADDGAELAERLRASEVAELLVFARWVLVMTPSSAVSTPIPTPTSMRSGGSSSSASSCVTASGRAPGAGLGREDPRRRRARLLPELPLRGARRVADRRRARHERWRHRGPARSRRAAAGRLFAPGQSVRWDRLVEQATGAPLAVDSLAREVAGARE